MLNDKMNRMYIDLYVWKSANMHREIGIFCAHREEIGRVAIAAEHGTHSHTKEKEQHLK